MQDKAIQAILKTTLALHHQQATLNLTQAIHQFRTQQANRSPIQQCTTAQISAKQLMVQAIFQT
jgi:hypothetical protein